MTRTLTPKNRTARNRKRNKGNGKRFFRLLLMCFCCALVGSWIWKLWYLNTAVESQLKSLTEQKTALLEKKADLQEEIVRLNTPSYIEQLAREQLGLVRPGEILVAPKEETKK